MYSSQMQGLFDSHMTAENHGDIDGIDQPGEHLAGYGGGSRSIGLTRVVVAVSFPARRQQPRELVAVGRASFGHRFIDVAFDGSNRQRQPFRDIPVGQPLPDKHHDFSFAVGQRQSFGGLAQSCRAGAALLGQRFGPCRATQRRPRVSPCAGRRWLRATPHRPRRSNRPYHRIWLTLPLTRHHRRHATLQRNGRPRRHGALQRSLQALAIEARRNAPRTA